MVALKYAPSMETFVVESAVLPVLQLRTAASLNMLNHVPITKQDSIFIADILRHNTLLTTLHLNDNSGKQGNKRCAVSSDLLWFRTPYCDSVFRSAYKRSAWV